MAPLNNKVRIELVIPIEFYDWNSLIRQVGLKNLATPGKLGKRLTSKLIFKGEECGVPLGTQARAEILWRDDE